LEFLLSSEVDSGYCLQRRQPVFIFAKNKGITERGQTRTANGLDHCLSCIHLTPQHQVCLGKKVPSRGDRLVMQGNQPPESVGYKTPGTGPILGEVDPGQHNLK
jgi:hypothetical protein